MITVLNIDIRQRPVETCWAKEYPAIVCCYANGLAKLRSHLVKTQFDIVITGYEGSMGSWSSNKMTQRCKERAMSSNNLVQLFQCRRNITGASRVVRWGYQEIKCIT